MTVYIIGWIILRILIITTVILGVIKLIIYIKLKTANIDNHCHKKRGETVLKERYAAGEITEKEYHKKLKVLRS